MYRPADLRTAFSGLIGLQMANVPLPSNAQISAPLTTSSTGIYVQDKHPLVSLENIYYCAPDFNINSYPIWISGSNYYLGQVTNDGGTLYQTTNALINDTIQPHLDLANWSLFFPFQTWLLQKYNQAVTNLFAEVVKQFKLSEMGKSIIERQQLFRGAGSLYNAIISDGSAVGFEIITQQAEALMVQIDLLGTQFKLAQNLNFYLYHSSNPVALKVFNVIIGGGSSFNWSPIIDCIMMYLQQNTQGTYFFMYFQSDLIAGNSAISKAWNCSEAPCVGCDGEDLLMYNRWSRYTSFRNVKVSPQGISGYSLPNMQYATYGSNTNWGLNFSLTVRCDLTDFIIYSKNLYADVFAMQLCLEFLRSIAQSSRIEPSMSQIKNQARAELNVSEKSTFINQYWDSIRALKADMSGFSSACQPCNDRKATGKIRSV